MNVLIIGNGGRENAIAWSVYASPLLGKLFCMPGNPGIANYATCINGNILDNNEVYKCILEYSIDVVIVGPETPLVNGIVDFLENKNIKVFGPSFRAAKLEGSKIFAREFCKKYSIPQPNFQSFSNIIKAQSYIKSMDEKNGYVIKADGLASGKGVVVTNNRNEALNYINDLMVNEIFGDAGKSLLIEERLEGPEASIFALSDGKNHVLFSTAQDYERVFENNNGPNTGGMGSISPSPIIDEMMLERINKEIILPVINGMRMEGTPFKGVLYTGIMISDKNPKVIEFNVRFGDPETQALLPRLKSDFLTAILTTIDGGLEHFNLRWHDQIALNVVLASKGYPGKYEINKEITGLDVLKNDELVFHAGTVKDQNEVLLTNSGRVLSVTALSENIIDAGKKVYECVDKIKFGGCFFRNDIGN